MLELLEKIEEAEKCWYPEGLPPREWVLLPMTIVCNAGRFLKRQDDSSGFDRLMALADDNATNVYLAALDKAEDLEERYAGSGFGFGSSDHTFATKDFLSSLGIKTVFNDARLVLGDVSPTKSASTTRLD